MLGSCWVWCWSSVNLCKVSSKTLESFPVAKLNTLTFLSTDKAAIFLPSGENASPVGKVLFFANSNRSVSSFESKETFFGNLNSCLGPVQYSRMPALSTETQTSKAKLYLMTATGWRCKVSKTWRGSFVLWMPLYMKILLVFASDLEMKKAMLLTYNKILLHMVEKRWRRLFFHYL